VVFFLNFDEFGKNHPASLRSPSPPLAQWSKAVEYSVTLVNNSQIVLTPMATVRLDTELITDWQSFHEASKKAFGFPSFYGMNMDGWIDCLSYLYEDDNMTRFHLDEGETLQIEVSATDFFKRRVPEIFDALIECTFFVNQRYVEDGKPPALSLVFL
jgi:hypothetical protein